MHCGRDEIFLLFTLLVPFDEGDFFYKRPGTCAVVRRIRMHCIFFRALRLMPPLDYTWHLVMIRAEKSSKSPSYSIPHVYTLRILFTPNDRFWHFIIMPSSLSRVVTLFLIFRWLQPCISEQDRTVRDVMACSSVYGRNIDLYSCLRALNTMPYGTFTWRNRNYIQTGHQAEHTAIDLPATFIDPLSMVKLLPFRPTPIHREQRIIGAEPTCVQLHTSTN